MQHRLEPALADKNEKGSGPAPTGGNAIAGSKELWTVRRGYEEHGGETF